MKRARLVFLFSTLLILCPGQVAGARFQSGDSAEADKLSAQVLELYRGGKFDEALPLAKRVLAIRETATGVDSEPVAVALSNIAAIYAARQDYDQAESFYSRALAVYKKSKGAEDLSVAAITDRLAVVNYYKYDYDEAESLYLSALSIREKLLGAEHADVARSLLNLGNFYRAVKKYEKAVPIYQRVVAMREKTLGPDDRAVADAREDYACSLIKVGREEEAKKIWESNARVLPSPKKKKDDAADDSDDVINGKALSLPKPPFPEAARGRVQGAGSTVQVRVLIDESGKVIKACAVSGDGVFHEVSERAALGALFSPTLKENKPTRAVGIITYNFRSQ